MTHRTSRITVDDLHPELRPLKRKFPGLSIRHYWLLLFLRFLMKLGLVKTRCIDGVGYSDTQLTNAKLRVYKSTTEKPSGIGVLWIHGGGYVAGSCEQDNKLCSRYVKELNAVVCSTEYRLAPENKYPAGIDDCYEAWQWFQKQATKLGVDPSRIIVAGASGGGGMAAKLAQRIYDTGGVQPAVQALFCPMLDDRTAAKHELDAVKHLGWTNQSNRAGWSWYLGYEAGSDAVPADAVPGRRKDLSGLPPAWIGVGDIDLFYEEDAVYARRLQEAGVPVIFSEIAGGPHGFEFIADETPLAKGFFQEHFNTMRKYLGPTP